MQDSIFTRIIKGEVPAHKIYEDDMVIAFLTISPFADGHSLVVPKVQVDQIWDLDDETYRHLWSVAKKLGSHIKTVMGTERVGVIVKGFEVPHVHIHLVPVNRGMSLDPKEDELPSVNDASLAEIAEKLAF